MSIAERWIETISHNLANASTTAFKRDLFIFNEGLDRALAANGGTGANVGRLGAGPAMVSTATVWEVGNTTPTGNPLDLAITTAPGMFHVRTPRGDFYTRDGAFALGPDRQIVTKNGAEVLDIDGQPIVLPRGQLTIAPDGSIDVDGTVIAQIAFVTGTFTKVGDGMFDSSDPVPAQAGQVQVQQGFVEASNVNAIEEMIAMIRLNRAFEMAQRSATSQDESTAKLLRILQNP